MMPGKAINNCTHRAELIYKRCKTNCGFELSASGLAYLLIQQLRLRNEDLLRLLVEFQGRLPSNPDGPLHVKQKAKAHLKIVRPQQFTRTHHLSEHHPETQVTLSFVVDGGMLSTDPHEQFIALEREVE